MAPYCKKNIIEVFLLKSNIESSILGSYVINQDIDIEMPIIIIKIKHKIIQNALLDRNSKINIIISKLCKKLDYNQIELTPFTIKMAD